MWFFETENKHECANESLKNGDDLCFNNEKFDNMHLLLCLWIIFTIFGQIIKIAKFCLDGARKITACGF